MPRECLRNASGVPLVAIGWSREVNTSIGLTTLTSKVLVHGFSLSEDLVPVFF